MSSDCKKNVRKNNLANANLKDVIRQIAETLAI